jgi:DNA-directed RNA polymerase subunit RPC12/RpoP
VIFAIIRKFDLSAFKIMNYKVFCRFSHPNCLYTHKKTVHADQRSFVCHICGKTMSTLGNLKGHLETHKEASNVQCEVCGKR